jgi:low molecular weight protein-tyrosine phosphatase
LLRLGPGVTIARVPLNSVIFVCMGNICRSPMAALVFQHQLAQAGLDDVTVASAGTGSWHVGDPADRRAQAALRRRGYPTEHQAQQFRPEWFDTYDLVVAMDRDNQRDLRRLAPTRPQGDAVRLMLEFDPMAEGLDVPDPYYGGADEFDGVLAQIESACRGLLSHLNTATPSAELFGA